MAFDPIPVPVRGSATFNADAEAFALGISQFAEDYNALSSVLDAALTSTSTTSLAISTGSKTLTVQTGLGYVVGYPIRIASSASPTNYMDGVVTAYTTGTGSLTVNVTSVSGTGTFASWNTMVLPAGGNFASLTNNKFTGQQVFANEVTLASASTLNFTTGDANQFAISGTTAITAVTMAQGAVVVARFLSACTITHSTNLQVQGGASYTTEAGDIVTFTTNGTVVRAIVSPFSGQALNANIASKAEAEAATDNTKTMTPLRVIESIADNAIQYGSSVTFTGTAVTINASDPKRITLPVYNLSTSGTSDILLQLGTSSGFVTTGYTGSTNTFDTAPAASAYSSGFIVDENVSSAAIIHPDIILTRVGTSNTWKFHVVSGRSGSSVATNLGSGFVTLSAPLTQLRFTMANGTDTFDGGVTIPLFE